jgi:hypothetical protein
MAATKSPIRKLTTLQRGPAFAGNCIPQSEMMRLVLRTFARGSQRLRWSQGSQRSYCQRTAGSIKLAVPAWLYSVISDGTFQPNSIRRFARTRRRSLPSVIRTTFEPSSGQAWRSERKRVRFHAVSSGTISITLLSTGRNLQGIEAMYRSTRACIRLLR